MFSAVLLRAGILAVRYLPEPIIRRIAATLADLSWLRSREPRRAVEANVSHLVDGAGEAERRRLSRATFRNRAACMVDLLRLPSLGREDVAALVEWEGLAHLDAALARGKGVLAVTAHVGNWEVGPLSLNARGYQGHAVVERLKPHVHALFLKHRKKFGGNIIALGGAQAEVVEALRRGDGVYLGGDRVIGTAGIPVPFAGGRRPVPTGPASLALSTGAAVLIVYAVLHPPGTGSRYRGVIEPEVPTGDLTPDDVTFLTERIADRLARVARQYPDQWFVFRSDWIADER
jgi:phosphatidylinositol dimannoside acyltransferase